MNPAANERPLSIPSGFAPAKPSGLSRETVEEIAESVAEAVGYNPSMHLGEVAGLFGASVKIRDYFDSPDDGSILIGEDGNFDIFLPVHTSPIRDRFTVAHEIGHYILHYEWHRANGEEVSATYASRYGSDRAEWEANWFAAAFLMPSREFARVAEGKNKTIADVAAHFGVSPAAAEIREKALLGTRKLHARTGNTDSR